MAQVEIFRGRRAGAGRRRTSAGWWPRRWPGRDGARRRPAARRQHEPALHLAQAAPAGADRPTRPAAVPGFAAVDDRAAGSSPYRPAAEAVSRAHRPLGLIEIELPDGGRVRISGAPDPAVVAAALRALVGR